MKNLAIAISGKLFLGLNFLVYGKFGLFFASWALLYASFFAFWELLVLLEGSRILPISYLILVSTFVIACGFYKPKNENEIDIKKLWPLKILSALVVIASIFVFEKSNFKIQFKITSNSMEPSLFRGDPIMTGSFGMPFVKKTVNRGDIVIHTKPGDEKTIFVHRVFAIPGDEVAISKGNVFLNGVKQLRPNLKLERDEANIQRMLMLLPHCESGRIPKEYCEIMAAEKRIHEDSAVWSVSEGRYFLLGDNVFNSTDSKHYGPVDKAHILGKVICYGIMASDYSFEDILRAGQPIGGLVSD